MAFAEYAFLWRGIDLYGIPAFTPDRLAAPDLWQGALKAIEAIKRLEDCSIRVTFANDAGYVVAVFKPLENGPPHFLPQVIEFFAVGGEIVRKIEVVETVQDLWLGRRVKKWKMHRFASPDLVPNMRLATWTYEITDFSLNLAIEEDMEFDSCIGRNDLGEWRSYHGAFAFLSHPGWLGWL